MNTIKKLITSILIICMFLRLPVPEVKASEAIDNFYYPLTDSEQADCAGLYTIFSPCYTFQINITDNNGYGTLELDETLSNHQPLWDDEDQALPWNNDSEPPQLGFLIPVLHF